jgi:hypothetical protein
MTQRDQSNCPRCGGAIKFRKDGFTIYPHKDRLVGSPCPMGGLALDYAKRLVEDLRREIRSAAR